MRNYSDYAPSQFAKLPPETQIVLLRMHVRKWIEFNVQVGVDYDHLYLFDKLIRLCRTHPYRIRRKR